jgi:predicted ArsR family transcriptional regulator
MEARLPGAARALGMTSVSVRRVLDALQWLDTSRVSAQDLSDALGVGQRSARRILLRLQRHGVIEPSGTGAGPGAGRPRTLYRVHPERLLALAGSDSGRR